MKGVIINENNGSREALTIPEQEIRLLVETIPTPVWRAAPEGNIEYVNKRALEYFGVPADEILGWGWMDKVHPDDIAFKVRIWLKNLQSEAPHDAVCRFRGADSRYRWFNVRGEPLRAGDGTVLSWYGVLIDIDERKNAEDRLRRSEAHLAEAQRLTHIGVGAYNGTKILFWSEETYRIWGFDPALDVPSREAVFQRIHPEDRDRMLAEVQHALDEKRRHSIDYRIVLPDGTVKYLKSIGVPEFSASGKLVEIVVTQIDVTERKRAQEEHERLRHLESDLVHMDRLGMMGELAASLAHEIAQPIATARNNARAALNFSDRGSTELDQVREALTAVVDDADRAGDILERIRDHIRKAPPRKERVDLNKAITDVPALAQGAIVRNGVSVQTRLVVGLPYVQVDRIQIQQVVLNLILNAVEAMSLVKKGVRELAVSTEQLKADGVLVAVRDSGPGIDPNISIAFSRLSTPRNPTESEWGSRSAVPSSMPMEAGCGQT